MGEITETLCPFCNGVLDIEMFNGSYGCDTGCDYVRFEVDCPHCHKMVYQTGDFGEFDDTDEEEYRERFMADFAIEVQRINARKAKETAP